MSLLALLTAATALAIQLDEAPKTYQKDYAPADGSTVRVNPPPFIWVPPKDGLLYLVEIAPTADFSCEGVRRHHDISISTLALREPLAPGEWYWRYAIQEEAGAPNFETTTFSKTRGFTVPEGAMLFPFPELDTAIARVPKERPRLFVLPDEVASYRERVASGDLKDYPARTAKRLDEYVGKELVAEPPYVEGKGAERGQNYAKIFRSTRPPMDAMEQLAFSYLLTGNEAHGNEAKRRLLHFFAWDPEGSTQYWHNDEPAMWVMMRGVRAYDWTYNLFSAEECAAVEGVMRIRAAQFYKHLKEHRRFHTNPFESHAGRTIGFLGEAAIAFAHEWPEAREWLEYVLTCYWNVYPAWGQEDGGWHEGPGYYSAYMSFVLHFIAPLKKATGIDLMQKPFFRNTPNYLLYSNPPYARISPFGDGENGGASGGRGEVMNAFATLLGDPYARWYAEQQNAHKSNSVLGIVLRNPALEARPPSDLPPAHYFPGVGLVSLHTALGQAKEDIHFLIHSDPYGAISHAHADQNAFTLEAYGEALAIASGYYPWYGSDHHRLWQWESKSSNTITFDGGQGQKVRDPNSKGAIVAFQQGEDYDYVAADATRAYPGKLDRFLRHVIHVRPGVFVLYDDLASPEPRRFEWLLHTLSEMELFPEESRVISAQGDARLRVDFLMPAAIALEQTAGFEPPPERGGADQYHLVASNTEPAKDMQFLTVLRPYKTGTEDSLPPIELLPPRENEIELRIPGANGTHSVVLRTTIEERGKSGRRHVDVQVRHRTADRSVDKAMSHRLTELTTTPDEGAPARVVMHVPQ